MNKNAHIKHFAAAAVAILGSILLDILRPDGPLGHYQWAAVALVAAKWAYSAFAAGGPPPPAAAVLLLLAAIPLLGGATCSKPGPVMPPGDAGPSFVNCSDAAIHQAALNILPDVENALAVDGYAAKLKTLIASLAGPLALSEVECAVAWVENNAALQATATADSLEATKAAHAKAWLASKGVQFAAAPGGGPATAAAGGTS